MREIVTIPGKNWSMHGIVHVPETALEPRTGVVLLHENPNTKFGTHRIFRELADLLCEAGFYVLRFDERGMNDSPGTVELDVDIRVEDARYAARFFRSHCRLEKLVGWGLCMGSVVTLHSHAAARHPEEKYDAMVLCSILADPAMVSSRKVDYVKADIGVVVQQVFRGNILRKLWEAPGKMHIYRQNVPKLLRAMANQYLHLEPEVERVRAYIAKIAPLLSAVDRPSVMIFGEKDKHFMRFTENVNPNDKLGLKTKEFPPSFVVIKDGDHTFSSRPQMEDVFAATLDWVQAFHRGLRPEREQAPVLAHKAAAQAVLE